VLMVLMVLTALMRTLISPVVGHDQSARTLSA
jgi:hypothetical protein